MRSSWWLIPLLVLSANIARAETYRAFIVSRCGTTGIPDDQPKISPADKPCTLYAVVVVTPTGRRGGPVVYADTAQARFQGRSHRARPLAQLAGAEKLTLRWDKVELEAEKFYDNVNPSWHWDEIDYALTALPRENDRAMIIADARPVRTPDMAPPTAAHGLGVMRFRVTVGWGEQEVSSPGIESRFAGGLADTVHRIAYRGVGGVGLVDAGYAFYNIPYIWGSAHTTRGRDSSHQTELGIGSDCADFVVAARRLQGDRTIVYKGAFALAPGDSSRLTQYVARKPRLAAVPGYVEEVYTDPATSKPVIWDTRRGVRPGDLILYQGHVGIMVRDEQPLGVLDPNDILMHSYFATPRETAIRDGYPGEFSIVRFRKRLAGE